MAQPEFSFPQPDPQDISFYEIKDGDRVNADVWNRERACQLQRQKLYSQSLCEPGIVCGLRVRVCTTDEAARETASEAHEGPVLISFEVEEGLAIDGDGNILILTKEQREKRRTTIDFSQLLQRQELQHERGLYIIHTPTTIEAEVQEDPEHRPTPEMISLEGCTLEVKKIESYTNYIELCRFSFDKNIRENGLYSPPKQFYNPGINELDFRFRRYFKPRTTKVIRVGFIQLDSKDISLVEQSFRDLMTAVDALYPNLRLQPIFDSIQIFSTDPSTRGNSSQDTNSDNIENILHEVDFLFWKLDDEDIESLTRPEDRTEDVPKENSPEDTQGNQSSSPAPQNQPPPQILESQPEPQPQGFRSFISQFLAPPEPEPEPEPEHEETTEETQDNNQETDKVYYIKPHIQKKLKNYLEKGSFLWIETPGSLTNYRNLMTELYHLNPEHHDSENSDVNSRILTTPFTFVRLPSAPTNSPTNGGQPSEVFLQSRSHLLLCQGELSLAWLSLASNRSLTQKEYYYPSRSEIREAQELGINILNFIWDLQQVRGFHVDHS